MQVNYSDLLGIAHVFAHRTYGIKIKNINDDIQYCENHHISIHLHCRTNTNNVKLYISPQRGIFAVIPLGGDILNTLICSIYWMLIH